MCTETKDARVHCTILNDHTNRGRTPPTQAKPAPTVQRGHPLRTQQCANPPTRNAGHQAMSGVSTFLEQPVPTPPARSTRTQGQVLEPSTTTMRSAEHTPANTPRRQRPVKLLRKEVIQPHLPVRLPCYDFVPIARPTFDSSLRKRLGHWLRVLPTFVT